MFRFLDRLFSLWSPYIFAIASFCFVIRENLRLLLTSSLVDLPPFCLLFRGIRLKLWGSGPCDCLWKLAAIVVV